MVIDLFANCFLWLLMWCGAVIALAESGDPFLAILLTLSGVAKLYVEYKRREK